MSAPGAGMQSISPSDGRPLELHREHAPEEVERLLAECVRAAHELAAMEVARRAELLLALARELRREREVLAREAALEIGKPLAQGRAELDKCALACELFAAKAEGWLEPELVETEASRSFVRFDPLGVVLAVMPWNFPYWQVLRCAAPALAAGNAVALKHAPNAQGCARHLERLALAAGFPRGALLALRVGVPAIQALIADARIAAVAFTGSTRAGAAIGAAAGSALKKCVLELGGSDAFVVLADAELDQAAKAAARARIQNAGQSCIAAKRFIVEERVHDGFVRHLKRELAALRVGDPLAEETEVGPLARADLRETLHAQLQASVAQGARVALGGELPDGAGWYYPPTLLTGVRPGMRAFEEETFGPLAAVVRARDLEHALELANRSEYGLGASLWTKPERGLELAPRVQAGQIFVNAIVKSDPRLPFGGVKRSGHGRELSRYGLLEFCNLRSVWVA